ncbi:hypothetical protein KC334_g4150 [Hortaea werneckii]|nr:hypothetical protein KC334_g4150 [Hortaea werneckii]KAI7007047.1 hypothetical protein KC355_g7481 [Hortaea werneckii]
MREYDEKLVKYGRSSEALGIAEEKLCHQSSALEEFISEIKRTPPFQIRAGTSEPSSTTASSFSKKGTHHDLVLLYHAKRSDVEIFEERVNDLQDEYDNEKANRRLQRDQDIEPEPSDEEFALYYEESIRTNRANMEQNRQEMEAAENKCHLLGLDVNIGLIKDWAAEEFETILPDSPQGSVHGSDSPLQHPSISTSERTFQWVDSTDPSGFAFEMCRDIAAFELAAAKEQMASNDYSPEAYRVSGGLRRIHSEPLFSTLWHIFDEQSWAGRIAVF